MKRTYLLVILFGLAVTSCSKKDFTCKCDGGIAGQGMRTEIKQTNQTAAQKTCTRYESEPSSEPFTNCRLL